MSNTNRRKLHFNSIDDALADVESLAAAERAGTLRACGQWTFGQILGHLAAWLDYAYTGAPVKMPFFIPPIARLFKKRILTGGMPAGSKIPRVDGGTLAKEVIPTDEGLSRFRHSFARLKTEKPGTRNILLGELSHAEWIQFTLRHVELHLSFLRCD